MATSVWSAARSGLLGDTGAVNAAAQVNQLLGTHGISVVYQGNQVVTPNGSGLLGIVSGRALCQYDVDQPFTMSGTTIGRVTLPVIPVGTGSDMIVSLCTDSSGSPGTVLTQTRIPANWITSLAYASGVGSVGSAIVFNASGSPLALPQFNAFRMGSQVGGTWPYPSVNNTGGAAAPASCYYGNYLFTVGGVDSNNNAINNVFSSYYDSNGSLSSAVPQASTPTNTDGSGKVIAVAEPGNGAVSLVLVGGGTTFHGTPVTTVYTSQFNNSTGVLSSWSVQTAFPQIIQNQGMATYNGYVYVIGGANGSVVYSTVYYAQVQNGQISSWTAATPLPQGRQLTYCSASNGFLFVGGGTDFGQTAVYSSGYIAPINADGSLGNWLSSPAFPSATNTTNLDQTVYGGPLGVITNVKGQNSMMVTSNGWDVAWTNESSGGGFFTAYIQTDPITVRVYGASTFGTYSTTAMRLFPSISVPLPTTGLTNGTKYHITVQSPSNDLNNYLNWAWDYLTTLPGNPTFMYRLKGSGTAWTTDPGAAMPITVYDGSSTGPVWHFWEDGGERVTTLAWGTTPYQPLLGILEATQQPGPVLNTSPTFTSGLGPWSVFNATAVTSNAFTHGNLPLSVKITPNGTSSQGYIESDRVPAPPQHSFLVSAWMYSPTGYNNIGVSVNWFNSSGSYISSTTASNITIPANTWTLIQGTVTNNVANATQVDVVCIEGGTPPATAIFYVSAATIQDTSGPMLSSVVQVTNNGQYPTSPTFPPISLVELA